MVGASEIGADVVGAIVLIIVTSLVGDAVIIVEIVVGDCRLFIVEHLVQNVYVQRNMCEQ